MTKYTISLFFTALLLTKATGSLILLFSSNLKDFTVTELLLETESEEKKGTAKGETGIDELFEKAVLPAPDSQLLFTSDSRMHHYAEALQDVCSDTLTPPPNTAVA